MCTCPGKARLGRYWQAAKRKAAGQDGSHKLVVGPVCSLAVDGKCACHIPQPLQEIPLQQMPPSVVILLDTDGLLLLAKVHTAMALVHPVLGRHDVALQTRSNLPRDSMKQLHTYVHGHQPRSTS